MISNPTELSLGEATGIRNSPPQRWHQEILSPRPDPRALPPVLEANGTAAFVVLLHLVNGHRPGLVDAVVVE